jgi:signal transduction histidine kinase
MIRQNRACFSLQQAPNTLPLGGVEFLDSQTHTPCPVQEWPISHALHGEVTPMKEFILRQQDGHELFILLQTAPIFISNELVAAVVAIQDITALKEADRAKNQFLMVLSHEVKTPLTSIIGWAQLAQGAPDVVPEALVTILHNAQDQKILLERLLILSRILTGKLLLSKQPTDLWQVALRAEQRLHHAAEERKITMKLEAAAGKFDMDADAKLLEQAVYEIIDNAINFTPTDGIITIQGHLEDTAYIFVVQDTGQGIAPEQLSTLLKPFSQILRQEEIGGLGIGLALVRGIIEAHGGRVTISSTGPRQGTTVTLRLPRAGDHATV